MYREGSPNHGVISWLEADGRVTPLIDQPEAYSLPRLSPDGARLAFSTGNLAFVYDIARRDRKRLIAQQGKLQDFVVWSPDGETIVTRADALISLDVATGAKLEIERRASILPWSFAPDGLALLGFEGVGASRRLKVFPVEKTPAGLRYGAPQPLDPLPGDQSLPAISPDGKWVAFGYRPTSEGRAEVFVAPYRPGDASEPKQKWQISFGGGGSAKWPKGGAIFFASDGYVMVAPYTVENGDFKPGKPRRWSEHRIRATSGSFDVTADGSV